MQGVTFAAATFASANFSRAKFKAGAVFHDATFNGSANFSRSEFAEEVDFSHAKFTGYTKFVNAHFQGANFWFTKFVSDREITAEVDFAGAEFAGDAYFTDTRFDKAGFTQAKFASAEFINARFKEANFDHAAFSGATTFAGVEVWEKFRCVEVGFTGEMNFTKGRFADANFSGAKFAQKVDFEGRRFLGKSDFRRTQFKTGANFTGAYFEEKVNFSYAEFRERTVFAPKKLAIEGFATETLPVFCDAEVDFRDVIIEPLDALVLRDADLSRCRCQGTDLRKAEITGALWRKIGSRFGVFDEVASIPMDATRDWYDIERLYRELKQNYEDRRDYERAGDFHYGEKEMRRINPKTHWAWRFVLGVYLVVSGYGERCLRPLAWASLFLALFTIGYLWCGLCPKDGDQILTICDWSDWRAWNYSLRVMTLLKPYDWVPQGCGECINTFASLVGPLLIGLFALTLRQRLKR
ncbi:MAG: pentapeptide repeat-containing protein [Desulfomonile tiedjei]|nr:pentapeptide repeat-containing protein [Desulfomonile tiedjei]